MMLVPFLSVCLAAAVQGGDPPPPPAQDRMPAEPMPIPVGMARALGDRKIQIDGALEMIARPESVGGTPAGRLLHYEKSTEPDSTLVSVAAMEWR